jgi:glutaredoxin 3
VDYRNIREDDSALDEMLVHSAGERRVPVILEEGKVTIGFGGT